MSERRIGNLIEVWADRYRGARRQRTGRLRLHLREQGRGYRGDPAPPARPDLRLPIHPTASRKGAASGKRVQGAKRRPLPALRPALPGARGRPQGTAKSEHFTAFIPFYAHFPYEAHVYSRRCAPSIADLESAERRDLASVLKRLLVGYDCLFGFSLPYMMVMHQAPTDGENYDGIAHFHIEFYPPNRTADKLKYLAGSETGAGAFIMDVLPEMTAETLRGKIEGS